MILALVCIESQWDTIRIQAPLFSCSAYMRPSMTSVSIMVRQHLSINVNYNRAENKV